MHRDPIAVANEWRAKAEAHNLTTRELIVEVTGRQNFVGSAATIAESIDHLVQSDASDGFILVPHVTPGGLDPFVDRVVPLLQERGVFRTDYEGTTLREHLGLALPELRDTGSTRPQQGSGYSSTSSGSVRSLYSQLAPAVSVPGSNSVRPASRTCTVCAEDLVGLAADHDDRVLVFDAVELERRMYGVRRGLAARHLGVRVDPDDQPAFRFGVFGVHGIRLKLDPELVVPLCDDGVMSSTAATFDAEVSPAQRLEVLFEELAELTGQRNAIDGRIVEIVAELDRDELCGATGARSIAALVAWKTGVTPHNADTVVAVARRLDEFPAAPKACARVGCHWIRSVSSPRRLPTDPMSTMRNLPRWRRLTQLRTAVKLEPRPQPDARARARTRTLDHQNRRRRVHDLPDPVAADRGGEVRCRHAVASRCADRGLETRSRRG